MQSFFLRDVFDEIWDLIVSVSEGFPTYFCNLVICSDRSKTVLLLLFLNVTVYVCMYMVFSNMVTELQLPIILLVFVLFCILK